MINRRSSLVDVAFAVCTALDQAGAVAVLVGGSAAAYYTSRYRSHDADFVITFAPLSADLGGAVVRRTDEILHLYSRTDSVRDRLAAFYHWNDRGSLRSALYVARSGPIDIDLVQTWSHREGAARKFSEFAEALTAMQ